MDKDLTAITISATPFTNNVFFYIEAHLGKTKVGYFQVMCDMAKNVLKIGHTEVKENLQRNGIATKMRDYLRKHYGKYRITGRAETDSGRRLTKQNGHYVFNNERYEVNIEEIKNIMPAPEMFTIQKPSQTIEKQ